MTNFLMYVIDYVFVACVWLGTIWVMSVVLWGFGEFFRGFLSVLVGVYNVDSIMEKFPYVVAGTLLTILLANMFGGI